MNEVMQKIPVINLEGMTIFPDMVIHFDISKKKSINAVEYAMVHGQKLFVTRFDGNEEEDSDDQEIDKVGTLVEIRQIMKLPNNVIRVLVRGIERARVLKDYSSDDMLLASIELMNADNSELDEITQAALVRNLAEAVKQYAAESSKVSKDAAMKIIGSSSLRQMIYKISAEFVGEQDIKQMILAEESLFEQYDLVKNALEREIEIERIRKDFMIEVKTQIDKRQKEYVLREQMRIIREELGEEDADEAEEFMDKTDKLNASKEVKDKLYKEIRRYNHTSSNSAEANVIRNYIETLLDMPWDNMSEDNNDIKRAKSILEKEHYGLEKVKERVLEFLAVRAHNQAIGNKTEASVICLVGPPGTGKTSIAASIARALDKKYVRVCLGGVRDEAEIRGHRKTYIGAMPGRIVEGIKQAGVKNPLMLLDEIDKTGTDARGDTASALLEVLDTAQNSRFMDHYMEVPIDLSQVLFIATANDASAIPKPLYDRMEIIELNSYTENEKFHIAKQYLVKKQLDKAGLSSKNLSISDTAIRKIISGYTREAGVRNLERNIGSVCRKTVKKQLLGELAEDKCTKVTAKNIEDFLGKEKFKAEKAEHIPAIGCVTGLAWTSVGGDTLTIEVNVMPGKGEMILTGNLGDVMKESARIAMTYVRSIAVDYGVDKKFFEENSIHIHIPEGAVPKDGPSAGITMTTAILSAVTGIPVKAELAMTGEVTLRGKVLAIGGLKEKLLAAGNYGIKTVLVPESNKSDVAELDKEITDVLDIHFVGTMKDVIALALTEDKRVSGEENTSFVKAKKVSVSAANHK